MQPLQNCIGPTIRIGQEILCLPYAGFLDKVSLLMINSLHCVGKVTNCFATLPVAQYQINV